MSRNEKLWFLLSFIISIFFWWYIISLKFGVILTVSLLIHEYGHYWWMGKDGIKNRTMFFLPPFGAMAMAKDMWLTYGAESRIALAGPIFGFIPAILASILWNVTGLDLFGAAIILICWINLFNAAVPIPILDGGHVIKAVLFSIHYRLGIIFYEFGFILTIFIFLFVLSSPVFLFILFMLYRDFKTIIQVKDELEKIEKELNTVEKTENFFEGCPEIYKDQAFDPFKKEAESFKEKLNKRKELFDKFCNMPKMTPKEMFNNLTCLLLTNAIYVFILLKVSQILNTSLTSKTFLNFFK